jgi:predicted nucleic acid-binding protein
MILVDTSVWIRFLAGRAPYAKELGGLLALNQVLGHDLVYGELLIGDRGGRQKFLAAYDQIDQVPTVPHREIVDFVRNRKLHGRGAGWIDAHLLAATLVSKAYLWTVDSRLLALAREVGVAYELSLRPDPLM